MNTLSKTLHGWSFDWRSSLITALVVPLVGYFLVLIRNYLKSWGAYLIECVMYAVGRSVRSSIAARASVKRYCRLMLQEESRYLFVP